MATSTSVPVEEYLRTSYDPDMEYLDGELVERHVGEYTHSYLQLAIGVLLESRQKGKYRTFTEQRVRVSTKPRYRIPDLCVMELPHPREPVFTHPPHLVIEIVSPDDELADLLAKVADYLKFGVPHIWIPDPYKHTLQEADREGLRPRPDLITETDLVGRVDFGALFAKVDEPSE